MSLAASWIPPAWICFAVMRWGVLAAGLLWSTAAWAEGGPPNSDALVEALKTSGPWGMVSVCFLVIWTLWGTIKGRDDAITKRDDVIRELQEKRATEAAEFGRVLATATAQAMTTVDGIKIGMSDLKTMGQAQLDLARGVQQGFAALSTALDRNYNKIDALPETVRGIMEHRDRRERA